MVIGPAGLLMFDLKMEMEEPTMKRILFVLLATSMSIFGSACKSGQNANQPAPLAAAAAAANKPSWITITYAATTPAQLTIDAPQDGIKISKGNKDTIKWKVKYIGPGVANAADVTLDNFTAENSDQNPFGDGSAADNTFSFNPTDGSDQTKDTKPANKIGTFRYTITVKLPNNGPVLKVDPVVVVGD